MVEQKFIFRVLHIVFELIAFICCLVAVCHGKCWFPSNWAFAFSVSVISLFWWPALMIQEKCQCFTWSGMPTLEKIMWFILYHFAFAAAIITISYNNGAAIAANVFWWFDLLVYFVEAALMARIFDHVEIKGLTDQGAPKSNVEVSKK